MCKKIVFGDDKAFCTLYDRFRSSSEVAKYYGCSSTSVYA
jgi:hypothetical protein